MINQTIQFSGEFDSLIKEKLDNDRGKFVEGEAAAAREFLKDHCSIQNPSEDDSEALRLANLQLHSTRLVENQYYDQQSNDVNFSAIA